MLGEDFQVLVQGAQSEEQIWPDNPSLPPPGPDSSWCLMLGSWGPGDSPPGLALGEIMQVLGALCSVPPHLRTLGIFLPLWLVQPSWWQQGTGAAVT